MRMMLTIRYQYLLKAGEDEEMTDSGPPQIVPADQHKHGRWRVTNVHVFPVGVSFPCCRYTLYIVEVLDGQAMKLSCLGDVVIIVSPSRPQLVVVAVFPKVSDL